MNLLILLMNTSELQILDPAYYSGKKPEIARGSSIDF
ncbi:hypothetical protein METHB2_460026 [Candidatus Methylobacter favarea]|uniref:Uncharacterized protein n=1 Tax=Candidatus Methylobacter favarea TaxID=2707345 RepID=A0A8S0WBE1_9GAMM|nr:hypothetical protein METHB2_460026 [Candidatus Methylobacter favarea]